MEKDILADNNRNFAIIGIFITDIAAAGMVNNILHEYAEYIIGRIGLPRQEESIHIISVIINAPADKINALSGKLGRINGIRAKAMQAKL